MRGLLDRNNGIRKLHKNGASISRLARDYRLTRQRIFQIIYPAVKIKLSDFQLDLNSDHSFRKRSDIEPMLDGVFSVIKELKDNYSEEEKYKITYDDEISDLYIFADFLARRLIAYSDRFNNLGFNRSKELYKFRK